MKHPDDANGDALRRLESHGDDLSKPRNIDFTVVFANEVAANTFAEHFRNLSYVTSIDKSETAEGLPWDVCVIKHMIPSYDDIVAFEDELESIATPLLGRNDGWGCITQNGLTTTPN